MKNYFWYIVTGVLAIFFLIICITVLAVTTQQKNPANLGKENENTILPIEEELESEIPPFSPTPTPNPNVSNECYVGGCSGQLCTNNPDGLASTCEWREEYACYREATCEIQPSGKCGWTPTAELKACLAN